MRVSHDSKIFNGYYVEEAHWSRCTESGLTSGFTTRGRVRVERTRLGWYKKPASTFFFNVQIGMHDY